MSCRAEEKMKIVSALIAGALLVPALTSAASAGDTVRWKTVVGLIRVDQPPGTPIIPGIPSGGQPWTTLGGDAFVDLQSGRVEFEVKGLVLADGAAVGTTGPVTAVVGTLACNVSPPGPLAFVNTTAVPLSPQGDARFEGTFDHVPMGCDASNAAFLVRNAAGNNGWLANGAVRLP
jgi:hypothetical protein